MRAAQRAMRAANRAMRAAQRAIRVVPRARDVTRRALSGLRGRMFQGSLTSRLLKPCRGRVDVGGV
jgi:hypothetical protein